MDPNTRVHLIVIEPNNEILHSNEHGWPLYSYSKYNNVDMFHKYNTEIQKLEEKEYIIPFKQCFFKNS